LSSNIYFYSVLFHNHYRLLANTRCKRLKVTIQTVSPLMMVVLIHLSDSPRIWTLGGEVIMLSEH